MARQRNRRRRNRRRRQQNQQGNQNTPHPRRLIWQVPRLLLGVLVGLMLFDFSVANQQMRDTYVALFILVAGLLLFIHWMLKVPGLRQIADSAKRTFLKKRKAAFEEWCWHNAGIALLTYLLLTGMRYLGS